jgi:hypothetical protein
MMSGLFGFLYALYSSFFGGKKDEAIVGRPWWLDPNRRTKSRLKQDHRVMRGGHGVKLTPAQCARLTKRQQNAASLRHLGRIA